MPKRKYPVDARDFGRQLLALLSDLGSPHKFKLSTGNELLVLKSPTYRDSEPVARLTLKPLEFTVYSITIVDYAKRPAFVVKAKRGWGNPRIYYRTESPQAAFNWIEAILLPAFMSPMELLAAQEQEREQERERDLESERNRLIYPATFDEVKGETYAFLRAIECDPRQLPGIRAYAHRLLGKLRNATDLQIRANDAMCNSIDLELDPLEPARPPKS